MMKIGELVFEWDEQHRQDNIQSRGLDIAALGPEVLKDPRVAVYQDVRRDYGEDRFNAYGLMACGCVCVLRRVTTVSA